MVSTNSDRTRTRTSPRRKQGMGNHFPRWRVGLVCDALLGTSTVRARFGSGRTVLNSGPMAICLAAVLPALVASAQSTVRGTVLTEDGDPASSALVRVQTTENFTLTDESGRFVLTRGDEPENIVVAAWKHGYYSSAAVRVAWGDHDVKIVLKPYAAKDHPDYEWIGLHGPEGCAKCHADSIVPQWENNLHSQAATNVLVRTMYSGTDVNGKVEKRLSHRHDFPGNPGNCAACHAPGAAIDRPYGVFLDEVKGVDRAGVHCDFCHKMYDARIPRPGMPGVLSIELRRPPKSGRNLFFGPFDDTPQDNDSYLLLQTRSRFCAPCHSHRSWGVPIYTSFPEWFDSPYRAKGVECQDCHNAPDGKVTNVAPGQPSSPNRHPSHVPSHNMMGENRKAFIGSAVKLQIVGEPLADRIRVTTRLTNSGAGHHFPTGQPMRNALLVIRATDENGRTLPLMKGSSLPVHAGDFAGRPGRFYAKILEEVATNYPDMPSRPIRVPAPQWVQTRIQSDTRIPALATDESCFEFPKPRTGSIHVEANLIYRRTFPSFAELKGWEIPDVLVASEQASTSTR